MLNVHSRRFILALVLAAVVAPASATTYTITELADNAYPHNGCSLREAIRAAGTNTAVDLCPAGSADDVIELEAGVYTFDGPEQILGGGTIEISGASLDPTATVVDLQSNYGFLWSNGATAAVTLRGLSLQNGFYSAVDTQGISLTLDHMSIHDMTSPGPGAGVYWSSNDLNTLLITDSTFDHDTTSSSVGDATGGAVAIDAAYPGTILLRDVVFSSNQAASNTVAEGGALWMRLGYANPFPAASCVRCVFDDNTAFGSTILGAALYVDASAGGDVALVDIRFDLNNVLGSGGDRAMALYARASGGSTVRIDRARIARSAASVAGASVVALVAEAGSLVSLTNAEVSISSYDGVSALADGVGARVVIGQSTIIGHSDIGALLHTANGGTVALHNSLVAFNYVDESEDAGVTDVGNCVYPNDDPHFVDIANDNYRLAADSPAVDAGADGLFSQLPLDLDHASRVAGTHPDCGAYELGSLFGDGFESGDLGSSTIVPAVSWSAVQP